MTEASPRAGEARRGGELPAQLTSALERLDQLIQAFEQQPDPVVGERVFEMLRCVDGVHRWGLRELAALVEEAGLLPRALDVPEVRLLFGLYGLEKGGERDRADAVLDTVRGYIESHGGRLELVEAEAGVVKVRLSGTCRGCAGSAATLRQVVEETLRAELVDFVRLEVVEPSGGGPPDLIPASSLFRGKSPALVWRRVLGRPELPGDGVRSVEVDGQGVLVVHLGGDFYAYQNCCPGTSVPLDGARLDESVLVCASHGCRFALPGGRRLDRDGPALGVVPIAAHGDEVRIGVLRRAPG